MGQRWQGEHTDIPRNTRRETNKSKIVLGGDILGFTFNGIRKDFVIIGRDWVMPGWGEVERKVINIDGRPGGVTTQFNERERRFSVPIVLPSSTFEQKERYVEELAEWLIHDKPLPLVFDKYPNRTLYAEIEGTFEYSQFTEHSEGFITFVCADPYKYGSEKHINFTSDAVYRKSTRLNSSHVAISYAVF